MNERLLDGYLIEIIIYGYLSSQMEGWNKDFERRKENKANRTQF